MPKRRKDAAAPNKTLIEGITDRALIRELFVKRKPHYAVVEAQRLTRSGEDEIAAAISAGEFQPEFSPERKLMLRRKQPLHLR